MTALPTPPLPRPLPRSPGVAPSLGRWLDAAAEVLIAAGVESARLDARLIAADTLGWDPARVLARPEHGLGTAETRRLDARLAARAARRPLAQVLERREFWSLDFRVSADTLVPRPESETIVEAVLAWVDTRFEGRAEALRILDLGTGTGCLMLALLSELPNANALGVDISEPALGVAADNAARLGLGGRARVAVADWGGGIAGRFDVIVANPPYIAEDDMGMLAPEVAMWEPALALVAGADGLSAYRALAPDVTRLLAPGGRAFIEIGAGQADVVGRILGDAGLAVAQAHRDLGGRARVIEAQHASGISAASGEKKVGKQGRSD